MYAKLTAGDLHLGIARGCRRHRLERPCCACGCHTWSTISLTSATDLLELVNECVVFGVNWSDKLLNDRSCVNDYQVTYDSHDIFSRGGNCCARAAAAAPAAACALSMMSRRISRFPGSCTLCLLLQLSSCGGGMSLLHSNSLPWAYAALMSSRPIPTIHLCCITRIKTNLR